MSSYRIELREIRLATDGTDDVALFDVRREDNGEIWIVPALMSPLFRLVNMRATVSEEGRKAMVGGLGARAIVDKLKDEGEPSMEEPLLFSTDYPGAPGDPSPLAAYEDVTVEVEEPSGPDAENISRDS